MNPIFRNAGHDRERRPVHVWRLRRHVKIQPAHRVEVRDAAARFERSRMTTLEPDTLTHALRAVLEGLRGGRLVANLPVVDVIRLLFTVWPQDDLVFFRRKGICDDGQRFVLDLHRLCAVFGSRARFGKHGRHFLVLKQHLADGQHHLFVEPVKRWQPSQPGRFEILPRDHRLHAGHVHRRTDVDVLDRRVRVRTAGDRRVQHPRHRDVVHVVALALKEAGILLALHPVAERMSFGFGFDAHGCLPRLTSLAPQAGA